MNVNTPSWTLPSEFRVRLTMLTDWHVGTGAGRPGSVDSLEIRDSDGFPYIPAKTLTGIWRDACERLCWGLDDGKRGDWSQWVDVIFGSQPSLGPQGPTLRHKNYHLEPLPALLQMRSAHLVEPLLNLLRLGGTRAQQVLTFIKPGVMIDPATGAAAPQCLRFEEMCRRGLVLEATCRLPQNLDTQELTLTSALLLGSSLLIERLGGKRRRGTGLCQFEIVDYPTEAALDWLRSCPTPPATLSPRYFVSFKQAHMMEPRTQAVMPSPQPLPAIISPLGQVWVKLLIRLKLLSPLSVTYRVQGNVVESLDHLPGFYLLPHITRTLPALRSLIPRGDALVLPAYLEIGGLRTQPVPLAWFEPKDPSLSIADHASPLSYSRLINRLIDGIPTDSSGREV
ncbi:MAG: hypothetical protein KatS3mg113_1046 [Planctomycetaceae bacterium]|nr:MAG: hypothetical protein KatS3mg113_1046 [Planctomycetaceae bacterium]